MNINFLKLLIGFTFFFATVANAYIDPFTVGFILQALAGIFATIVFYLGYPVRLIKKLIKKFSKKKKSLDEKR